MDAFRFPALSTILAICVYIYQGVKVGQARTKYNVAIPATNGPLQWERIFRAHQNMAENLPIVMIAKWLFALFVSPFYAGCLGVLWAILRFGYAQTYYRGGTVQIFTLPCYLIINVMLLGTFFVIVKSFIV